MIKVSRNIFESIIIFRYCARIENYSRKIILPESSIISFWNSIRVLITDFAYLTYIYIYFSTARNIITERIVVACHHRQFSTLKSFVGISSSVSWYSWSIPRWSDNRPVVYNYKSNRDRFNAISVPIKGKRRMNISLKITATREGGYRIFINRANGVDPCYAINVKRLYLSCNTSARKCRLFANCGECLRMQCFTCFKRFSDNIRDFFNSREFRKGV